MPSRPIFRSAVNITSSLATLVAGLVALSFEVSRHAQIAAHLLHSLAVGLIAMFSVFSFFAFLAELGVLRAEHLQRSKPIQILAALYSAWCYFFMVLLVLGAIAVPLGVGKAYFDTNQLPNTDTALQMAKHFLAMAIVVPVVPMGIMLIATALGFKSNDKA